MHGSIQLNLRGTLSTGSPSNQNFRDPHSIVPDTAKSLEINFGPDFFLYETLLKKLY